MTSASMRKEDACRTGPGRRTSKSRSGRGPWYADFDKCLPFFKTSTRAVPSSLAVCPWSHPGVGPRLANKLERERSRKALEQP